VGGQQRPDEALLGDERDAPAAERDCEELDGEVEPGVEQRLLAVSGEAGGDMSGESDAERREAGGTRGWVARAAAGSMPLRSEARAQS
jgi:hypothetical protein